MKLIKPSVEIIREPDNMKRIELCGRVCYKSEDRIADGTAEKFCRMLIERGHHSNARAQQHHRAGTGVWIGLHGYLLRRLEYMSGRQGSRA
jgi:hypothetical protein